MEGGKRTECDQLEYIFPQSDTAQGLSLPTMLSIGGPTHLINSSIVLNKNRCHTKVTHHSRLHQTTIRRIPGIPILPTRLARAQETDNLCQLQYPKYLSNICSDVFSSPSRTRLSYLIDSTQEYKEVLYNAGDSFLEMVYRTKPYRIIPTFLIKKNIA